MLMNRMQQAYITLTMPFSFSAVAVLLTSEPLSRAWTQQQLTPEAAKRSVSVHLHLRDCVTHHKQEAICTT